jgi:transcriptional regulator with XRE-family HTH domain
MAAPRSEVTRNLGIRVRELRHGREFTQENLAERADLSWSYVSQVERGQHNLGVENLLKLARALDVPPGELVNNLALPD